MDTTAGDAQPLAQGLAAEATRIGSCRRGCLIHLRSVTKMALSQVQDADWDDDSFLRLYLTTLAGTVIQMQVPVSIHHTWEMLEEYLVEHLPRNSLIETFGCELTLINADTQIALQDPIQEDLWKNNHFSLVVPDCFRMLEDNKPLQGLEYEDCPKGNQSPCH